MYCSSNVQYRVTGLDKQCCAILTTGFALDSCNKYAVVEFTPVFDLTEFFVRLCAYVA